MHEGDGAGCSRLFGLNKANRELRGLDLDILACSKIGVSSPLTVLESNDTNYSQSTLKHTKLKRCKRKKEKSL